MDQPWQGRLLGVYYDTHPHWVVDRGCYAVTLRCHGSLPKSVQAQLREIGESLREINPASEETRAYHRRHFSILEHALDHATGFRPFIEAKAAHAMMDFMQNYDYEGLSFDHWMVMPNHLHVVTAPFQCRAVTDFRLAWRRFKSRSARQMNAVLDREGRFWQMSWYDRWIRDEVEYQKWLHYLLNNPVKAGLRANAGEYPYHR